MLAFIYILPLLMPLSAPLSGQQPRFEVAAVNRDVAMVEHGAPGGPDIRTAPRSLTMLHVTLQVCIAWAYAVRPYQVDGPTWTGEDHFDILAKSGQDATPAQLRDMLRDLLSERFRLKVHRDRRNSAVHVITLARSGRRPRESDGVGPGTVRPGPSGMIAESATLEQFAEALAAGVYGPVIDETGLAGRYDFTLDLASLVPRGAGPADMAELLDTAMSAQLGLRLVAGKRSLEIIVIDHAERVPTAN